MAVKKLFVVNTVPRKVKKKKKEKSRDRREDKDDESVSTPTLPVVVVLRACTYIGCPSNSTQLTSALPTPFPHSSRTLPALFPWLPALI